MKRVRVGYSLTEMLVVMLLVSVMMVVTLPILTIKKKVSSSSGNVSTVSLVSENVKKCVEDDGGSGISLDPSTGVATISGSTHCGNAADDCATEIGTDCSDSKYYVKYATTEAMKISAERILRAACDKGGMSACQYFITKCERDSSQCDITASDDRKFMDLDYYLKLLITDGSPAKSVIETFVKPLFLSSNTNIVDLVRANCPTPNESIACKLYVANTPSIDIGKCTAGDLTACSTLYYNNQNRSCKQIHDAWPSGPSAVYGIAYVSGGAVAKRDMYCDMTTDGGGYTVARDCKQIQDYGLNKTATISTIDSHGSGVYMMDADGYSVATFQPTKVYCDMETDGGGYTVMRDCKDIYQKFGSTAAKAAYGNPIYTADSYYMIDTDSYSNGTVQPFKTYCEMSTGGYTTMHDCKKFIDYGIVTTGTAASVDGSGSGQYLLDPDGIEGAITRFKTYCDMGSGGYTVLNDCKKFIDLKLNPSVADNAVGTPASLDANGSGQYKISAVTATSGAFTYCDMSTDGGGYSALRDCRQIYNTTNSGQYMRPSYSNGDGKYLVDPDGSTVSTYSPSFAYCDMTNGGYTTGLANMSSCKAIKTAYPSHYNYFNKDYGTVSRQLLDPDGFAGPIAPYWTTCDFANGGWTLVMKEASHSYTNSWWTTDSSSNTYNCAWFSSSTSSLDYSYYSNCQYISDAYSRVNDFSQVKLSTGNWNREYTLDLGVSPSRTLKDMFTGPYTSSGISPSNMSYVFGSSPYYTYYGTSIDYSYAGFNIDQTKTTYNGYANTGKTRFGIVQLNQDSSYYCYPYDGAVIGVGNYYYNNYYGGPSEFSAGGDGIGYGYNYNGSVSGCTTSFSDYWGYWTAFWVK